MDARNITGGCGCGAVRYAIRGPIEDCSLCHCRMCQKAGAGPFMVFVGLRSDAVTWTAGQPKAYRSSSVAVRGFCADCGTPLTYQREAGRVSLTHGSLDDPSAIAPTERLSSETVLPWCEHVGSLPIEPLTAWLQRLPGGALESRQHPDHD